MTQSAADAVEVIVEFLTTLKMGQGIDEHLLGQLQEILAGLREDWKGQDFVPREVAGMLAELAYGIDSNSNVYKDEEQAERIRALAAELSNDVSEIFFSA